MRRFFNSLKYLCINLLVAFAGVFIHRDRAVVLFGAWMGQRYADNSRFLFEYVATHKNELGIKHAIWVSENQAVIDYLIGRGFEAYLLNSKQSFYWHLKSGIHIVCNMYSKTGKYKGDILGELSCGAKKVQLWHGVGIKACGNLVASTQKKEKTIREKVKKILYSDMLFGNAIFTPGCWKNRYHLTTGPENSRVAMLDYGIKASRIIEANYPREIDDFVLMPHEKQVVSDLLRLKREGKLIILYCPTFREMEQKDSLYQNPTDSDHFLNFLRENKYIWVEKRHFASSFSFDERNSSERYLLEPDFDINVIYQYIDLLVTDYSSASSDCIFRMKKVVSFVPDMTQYEEAERGFVSNYDDYYPGEQAFSVPGLEKAIKASLDEKYLTGENLERYRRCRKFLFSEGKYDMKEIFNKITDA